MGGVLSGYGVESFSGAVEGPGKISVWLRMYGESFNFVYDPERGELLTDMGGTESAYKPSDLIDGNVKWTLNL